MATRRLGDLIPIHQPDHPQNDPAIAKLSDAELMDAILEPRNGDFVTVKGDRVFDGNTRVNEARKRGFDPELQIPVYGLPEESP